MTPDGRTRRVTESEPRGDNVDVVVLSVIEDGELIVLGVYGPYVDEQKANEHVGILRDPDMLRRLSRPALDIHMSQHSVEDPSNFVERVERLLAPG
jgi:hypothetical protein